MELTFEEADLADACSCERLMLDRWGDEGFEKVSVRLAQLAAAAGRSEMELLPGVSIKRKAGGRVTIAFVEDGVAIQGILDAKVSRAGEVTRLRISELACEDGRRTR